METQRQHLSPEPSALPKPVPQGHLPQQSLWVASIWVLRGLCGGPPLAAATETEPGPRLPQGRAGTACPGRAEQSLPPRLGRPSLCGLLGRHCPPALHRQLQDTGPLTGQMPAALTVQGHPSSADSWAAALIKRAPWLWGDELRPAPVCKRFPQCAWRCLGRPFCAGPGPFLRLGVGRGGARQVSPGISTASLGTGDPRRTPEFSPHTLVMIVPLRARQLP